MAVPARGLDEREGLDDHDGALVGVVPVEVEVDPVEAKVVPVAVAGDEVEELGVRLAEATRIDSVQRGWRRSTTGTGFAGGAAETMVWRRSSSSVLSMQIVTPPATARSSSRAGLTAAVRMIAASGLVPCGRRLSTWSSSRSLATSIP